MIAREQRATFRGMRRSDGRVATRSYLAASTSVNCSATAARFIPDVLRGPGALDGFPNDNHLGIDRLVDGRPTRDPLGKEER